MATAGLNAGDYYDTLIRVVARRPRQGALGPQRHDILELAVGLFAPAPTALFLWLRGTNCREQSELRLAYVKSNRPDAEIRPRMLQDVILDWSDDGEPTAEFFRERAPCHRWFAESVASTDDGAGWDEVRPLVYHAHRECAQSGGDVVGWVLILGGGGPLPAGDGRLDAALTALASTIGVSREVRPAEAVRDLSEMVEGRTKTDDVLKACAPCIRPCMATGSDRERPAGNHPAGWHRPPRRAGVGEVKDRGATHLRMKLFCSERQMAEASSSLQDETYRSSRVHRTTGNQWLSHHPG